MISNAQLQYLEIAKVTKISGTNNVMLSYHDLDGRLQPSVVIGKKQLVLLYEKIAADFSASEYPGINSRASALAKEMREHLWPSQDTP
jgi:hypothetical protein